MWFAIFLLPPLNFIDLNHFIASNQDRGESNNIVLKVTPHSIDEALLNKVIDVFAELNQYDDQLFLQFGATFEIFY
jgi:hypothetical protein